jgi:hypothetical protein
MPELTKKENIKAISLITSPKDMTLYKKSATEPIIPKIITVIFNMLKKLYQKYK